jgi:hypothetical protein
VLPYADARLRHPPAYTHLPAVAQLGTGPIFVTALSLLEPAHSDDLAPPVRHPARPRLRTILGHLALSLLNATVVPGALFYVCFVSMNVWAALVAALAWCYGAIGWRLVTRRRMSGLLLITVIGLTARTALTFASGNTFLYFLQPVINNAVIASVSLLSLATARPVVARLAADFYPMNDELAMRPRVQQLFWRLTLLWAVACLAKAAVTLWLLESQTTADFVMFKSIALPVVTAVAVAFTVFASIRVARREGLLTHT